MKKILISSLVATAILCSGSSVVFASPVNTTNTKGNVKVENKIDATNIKYNHDHLTYAIEEMREAATIFESADLTNDSNYARMITFAKSSLDRVRSLDIYNNTENWNSKTFSWAKNVENNISWIEETGNTISDSTYRINRVLEAIDNVKIVFSRDKQESKENKENVINTLNQVLTQEYKSGVVNKTTLRNAVSLMHHYNNLIK